MWAVLNPSQYFDLFSCFEILPVLSFVSFIRWQKCAEMCYTKILFWTLNDDYSLIGPVININLSVWTTAGTSTFKVFPPQFLASLPLHRLYIQKTGIITEQRLVLYGPITNLQVQSPELILNHGPECGMYFSLKAWHVLKSMWHKWTSWGPWQIHIVLMHFLMRCPLSLKQDYEGNQGKGEGKASCNIQNI